MLLLVGLGNPTPDSENNRHNIGFKIIDAINKKFGLSKQKPKFKGLLTTGNIGNKKIYAIKPLTFMNNSGICIRELIEYFKIDDENVLRVPLPQFPNGSLLDVLNSMNYQKDDDPDQRNKDKKDKILPFSSIAGCYESYEIIKHTEFRSFWRSWMSKTQVVRYTRFISHLREYMKTELNNRINENN